MCVLETTLASKPCYHQLNSILPMPRQLAVPTSKCWYAVTHNAYDLPNYEACWQERPDRHPYHANAPMARRPAALPKRSVGIILDLLVVTKRMRQRRWTRDQGGVGPLHRRCDVSFTMEPYRGTPSNRFLDDYHIARYSDFVDILGDAPATVGRQLMGESEVEPSLDAPRQQEPPRRPQQPTTQALARDGAARLHPVSDRRWQHPANVRGCCRPPATTLPRTYGLNLNFKHTTLCFIHSCKTKRSSSQS